MRTAQVNLRLENDLLAVLEEIGREETLDRGSTIRKMLWLAIAQWKKTRALQRYQAGEISMGRAAEDSGESIWDLQDEARRRGIAYPLDVAEVEAQMERLFPRGSKVAEPRARYEAKPVAERVTRTSGAATLPECPPRPGGVLLVGVNPAPRSVLRGHYYQGRLGVRLWQRLARVGLLQGASVGQEDEAFVAAGHGLSDLVARATTSARELSREELRAGLNALRAKVRAWRPGLVLFAFKQAATEVTGEREIRPGPGPELEGVPTFLLSGPYSSREETARIDALLKRTLARVRKP